MTRKQFEAIAKIIREVRGSLDNQTADYLASRFAEYLATQNPLFNYDRFIRATRE